MRTRAAQTFGTSVTIFLLAAVVLVLPLAAGCRSEVWEFVVSSPRYDLAHAVWAISRTHAGRQMAVSLYAGLYDAAVGALSADELDLLAAAFAELNREEMFDLLSGLDPLNDDWLESGAPLGCEEIELMRLPWDRFLADWDARHWYALRERAFVSRTRPADPGRAPAVYAQPATDPGNPFKLVLKLLDASIPEPHVLFHVPSALGPSPYAELSSDSRLYRVDKGYVLTAGSDGRYTGLHAVTDHALECNWLRGGDSEELLLEMARYGSSWEDKSSNLDRERLIAEVRAQVLMGIKDLVIVESSLFGTGNYEYYELHADLWGSEWPGFADLLAERVTGIWKTGRVLTADDVLGVIQTWLEETPPGW